MMNKKRFIWLLKNSVKITTDEYPESIFYYMDQNIERQIKLMKVLDINEPIKINLNNIDDKTNILFEQDTKNKVLWVDYDNIWEKLKSNKEHIGLFIKDLIDEWLKDDKNLVVYTIRNLSLIGTFLLKDDTNWKVYAESFYLI